MRRFLLSLLASLARGVVRRQRTLVVGVTGSVGKTSTKEAIRAVLAMGENIRAAPKNYNNEIGFPIAIIGPSLRQAQGKLLRAGGAPGRSLLKWSSAIGRGIALALLRDPSYPRVLVLEYGADHPGDLAHLLRIAAPAIGVVTAVGPAHTEFFRTVERVIVEKRRLIEAVPRDGVAVLNRDDENVSAMRDRTRARVVTYGFHPEADVRGVEYQVTYGHSESVGQGSVNQESVQRVSGLKAQVSGLAFKVVAQGSTVPVHLTGCIGRGHASAALAAVAVGLHRGMHLVEIAHALERYQPPPGRLRVLPGVKGTTLVDDSYNSSPLAVAVALEALADLPTPHQSSRVGTGQAADRRFAVLGDMLELGALTEHAHEHVGELVASRSFDWFVTVGEAMRHAARAARASGLPAERVLEFRTAEEAGRFVQDLLAPGDVVLVKGSQGMRMERIVKELMAEPLRAKEILCRQDEEWLTRS